MLPAERGENGVVIWVLLQGQQQTQILTCQRQLNSRDVLRPSQWSLFSLFVGLTAG
jgi:hypothetical protein